MKTKIKISGILVALFLIINSINAQTFWNKAGRFQGNAGSFATVANSTSLNITGSFSIEFWMSPQTLTGTQTILSKGTSATLNCYGMQLIDNRVAILTDNVVRLQSAPIVVNDWTHVAGTYSSSTHQFKIYINGALDTSRTDIGAQPSSTTEGILIGKLPGTTPYLGKLDDLRIWNKTLSETEIGQFFRTSLGASGGIYNNLVMSITFQGAFSSAPLDMNDNSGNGNNATNNAVLPFELSNRPGNTVAINESLELDGNGDYLSIADNNFLNPTQNITLECWVYPRSSNACTFLSKGTNYRLGYTGTQLNFMINNSSFLTGDTLPLNQWSHLALSYQSSSGVYAFYLNGNLRITDDTSLGILANGTDSLFIGGTTGSGFFNGYIDELRILNYARIQSEINQFLYQSNDLANLLIPTVCFNFDGNVSSSGLSLLPQRLAFRNNARFSHPAGIPVQPVSPINRNELTKFSVGYYMSMVNKRIPETGTIGTVTDSTIVNMNTPITDVNLYVALNHTKSANLEIILVGPNGDSVKVFDHNITNSYDNNVVTVFNDQADSTLLNARYLSFSPVIKPFNNINSVFAGDNPQGKWKLIVRDQGINETGFLYAWGIQINNSNKRAADLDLSLLLQGFYNPTTNLMIPDSVNVNLRNAFPPYEILFSTETVVDNNGLGLVSFTNGVGNNIPFYIQIQHRNSIETWSKSPVPFVNQESKFSFVNNKTAAFGQNLIQVDSTPTRFAVYGGDVDQSGVVNLSNLTNVANAATTFTPGYVKPDVTGDNVVNLTDVILTFNNAAAFVSVVKP